jgi:hypothetical protein
VCTFEDASARLAWRWRKPKNADKATAAVKSEIARMRDKGATKAEGRSRRVHHRLLRLSQTNGQSQRPLER